MRPKVESEEGAVAVMVALSLVMLVVLTALVVDLGLARADRTANQTSADLAVTAASRQLDPSSATQYRDACDAALQYFSANTPDAAPVQGDPCSVFDGFTCDLTTAPQRAVAAAPPYEIEITIPVPSGHRMMGEQLPNEEFDGTNPCGRVGVSVTRNRDYLFAGVIGDESGRPVAGAVARGAEDGDPSAIASLVLLDRQACRSLYVSGQGGVRVNTTTVGGIDYPGVITLDSDGSDTVTKCDKSGQGFVVDVQRSAAVDGIHATGAIYSRALGLGEPGPGQAYERCDAGVGATCAPPILTPVPIPGPLVTRDTIDYRYNCRPSGYPHGEARHPSTSQPIDPCPASPAPQAHIDNLWGALNSGVPSGFAPYPGPCTGDTSTYPRGNWYVDCNPYSPSDVTFEGGSVVVFTRGVALQSGESLTVNPANDTDSLIFMRNGGFDRSAAGTLRLNKTMVYVEKATHNPHPPLNVVGGSAALTWTAPTGTGPCDPYNPVLELPAPSCFEDLALWSNSDRTHTFSGQGNLDVQGTFFTPNATPFSMSGGPGGENLQLNGAQFFSNRIEVGGQAQIIMWPNPETQNPIDLHGGGLIR